jgi:hypothetical protein
MERFHTYVQEAQKAFKIADHLVYVTYPVVHDAKLMAVVLEHLYRALHHGMEALLYYDALYKRNPRFPSDFSEQLHLFKTRTCPRYGISPDTCLLINDVADLIKNRRESPIEFSRKDTFVIASETYKLRTLTISNMKQFVERAKVFMKHLEGIHATSDRRFS